MIHNNYLKQPDWLSHKYNKEKLTTPQIAELCGCSKATVCRIMGNFGIDRRARDEVRMLRLGDRKYWNRRWLFKKYWKQGYGLKSLAKLCGVDRTTIHYWLKKHNIRTRNREEAYILRWETPSRLYGSFYKRFLLLINDVGKSYRKYF